MADEQATYELRNIGSPLTRQMLAPMTTASGTVQAARLPSDPDLSLLAEWLQAHPHVGFRLFDMDVTDLEFLTKFPSLRRIWVDCRSLASFEGLRHLPEDVEMVRLGSTKRRLDLAAIGRFAQLRSLHLEKHTKNIDVISGFAELEELSLRSISLPDLSLLTPLQNLKALELKLGGTRDLGLLPELRSLQYFEAWMVRGLSDLKPIAQVPTLRFLFLQALSGVDRLPDLGGNPALRRVHLEGMKGLTSVEEVAAAPGLLDLMLWELPKVSPESLSCLKGHRTLARVSFGLGSARKNKLAEEIVGLPKASFEKDWRQV